MYLCEPRWLRKAADIRRQQDDAVNATATEVKSGKRKGKAVRSPAKDSYVVKLGSMFLDYISSIDFFPWMSLDRRLLNKFIIKNETLNF